MMTYELRFEHFIGEYHHFPAAKEHFKKCYFPQIRQIKVDFGLSAAESKLVVFVSKVKCMLFFGLARETENNWISRRG